MSEINWNELDLGPVDAYALAVAGGYTGTKAQWIAEIAGASTAASDAEAYAKGTRGGEAVDSDDPTYHNNSKYYSEQAAGDASDSEAYSAGTRSGTAVDSSDPAYHNNANYYAGQAAGSATAAAASAAEALEHTQSVIETWLGNNIDPDSGYALDRTLTQSQAATPADITGDLKSAIDDIVYGTTCSFSVTPSAINKFKILLIKGETYTAKNNTGVAINVILYKADGTRNVIDEQVYNGETVQFVPDADDYEYIGGWVNSGATGTLDVSGGLAIIDSLNNLQDQINENIDDISEIQRTEELITKQNQTVEITDFTKKANYFFNINNQDYAANTWDYYTYSVKAGETYQINTKAGQGARAWFVRNSSQTILSNDSYDGDVKQDTFSVTIPENGVELIMNNKKGTFELWQTGTVTLNEERIYYNGEPLTEYLKIINNKDNRLYGKILCCCGDSITYGADMDEEGITDSPSIDVYQYSAYSKNWTKETSDVLMPYGYQIAERNGMVFYNGGVSGATMQGSGDGISVPGFSEANGEYTLLPNNIDYLLIWYGWNDNAFGTLGAITDSTNASYYGGFNVVLPYLIDKYPYTKIGLIVPFGSSAEHREAVRLLGNKWGVAVFDNYQGGTPLYYGKEDSVGVDASIVTANRAKFQANGAHPNYKGHKQLADMIEEWMRWI